MKHMTIAEIDGARAVALKAGAGRFWDMAHEISDQNGVRMAQITGPTRGSKEAIRTRFLICAQAKRMGYTLYRIGLFLHRDHTTIMSAVRRGNALLASGAAGK